MLSPEGQSELRVIRYNRHACEHENKFMGERTGCTANVVLITKSHFYVANVGDSKSVLCRGGQAVNMSRDHKTTSELQCERIVNAGGKIINGRVNGGLNMTRAFGDFVEKHNKDLPYDRQMGICKPDIVRIERSKQDQFILCGGDGIWEQYVDDSQGMVNLVKEMCKKEENRVKVVENLLETLIAEDVEGPFGCDNMSVVIVSFNTSSN